MCGLTGFFQPNAMGEALAPVVARMSDALAHRGPDDSGVWTDPAVGLALGHRRLAILDLSPAGHQPMHSSCGRYVLIFNGEIYNHLDLRQRLLTEGASPAWRGHSDTETLLACVAAWGIARALSATVGMFALVLWDKRSRTLTFARDRMGEKPLYYGWQNDLLFYGSELKALKSHPDFRPQVDRDALTLLLRHNCIPAPYSIYRGIHKLLPGHYLSVPIENIAAAKSSRPQPYWQLREVIEAGVRNPFHGSESEATDLVEAQLSKSVRRQMLSDVPLGAFLSGGVDSSTIVALMQKQTSQRVRTFTIGFDEGQYDESVHAKAVARHLGTDHTELILRPADALAVIPQLPRIYCEPFSDSSQIPTYLVSALARRQVTVALSGDGGDEIFGGYNRYLAARTVWRRMRDLPRFARHAAAWSLQAVPSAAWDRVANIASPLLPRRLRVAAPGDKAHKLAGVLRHADGAGFYRQLTSHWHDPSSLVIDSKEPPTLLTNSVPLQTDSLEQWMMAMDAVTYLPDDILAKVDRAAMANSLETRVPMLDHELLGLVWRMPIELKIRGNVGKWLLRQVLYRHVPRELIERPKMGFGIPLGAWLRGPLRDWAEDLLDEKRLNEEGFLRSAPIRAAWNEHLQGRRDLEHNLWDVLVFQAWLRQ